MSVDPATSVSLPTLEEQTPAKAKRPPLLTDSFKRPLVLFWVATLPQLILILLNLRTFGLISAEMNAAQRRIALQIFALEVSVAVASSLLGAALSVLRRPISWAWNWPLLLLPIAYLWSFVTSAQAAIPSSVADWILPQDQLVYYQFALIMPLIFYANVRLACAELNQTRRSYILELIAVLVAIPLTWYLTYTISREIGMAVALPIAAVAAMAVASTLLIFGVLTRVCVIGYRAVSRKSARALAIFSLLIGVILPLSGLWLNAWIAFPWDFQAWPVYAMALANGLLLLLPNFRHPRLHRLVWLAQCASFPFTFYFFLVFLPFLPLSLPAMICVGAGFLVLTPTILFFLHGHRLIDGYRHETRTSGRLTPTLLALLAFMILPGIYLAEAAIDRSVLRGAIDYLYSPNYRKPDHFQGSRAAVGRSLRRLRDSKAGLYLPFLSDFYNWAVFDNLTLPDEKMNAMHQAFFGMDLAAPNNNGVFGARASRRAAREARPVVLPPSDVTLVQLNARTVREGACERTILHLEMENRGTRQSEFVTQIKIPEGVFVSGYWLKVGPERVPGRIFEKKTALWVYHMIRDSSRRDPGILTYSSANTIDLRVFPFEPLERRETEIELLYPSALQPVVKIGKREWRAERSDAGLVHLLSGEGNRAVAIPPESLKQLPRAERVPYLHFIVDRSAGAKATNEQLAQAMRKAAASVPEAKECLITEANYESTDVTRDLVAIDSITSGSFPSTPALPARGGFLAGRAIKRGLLAHHDRVSSAAANSAWLARFPIIVLVQEANTKPVFESDLADFAKLAPDSDFAYRATIDGTSSAIGFDGQPAPASTSGFHPVALLQSGDAISACRLDADGPQLIHFGANTGEQSLKVYDHGNFIAMAPAVSVSATESYSRAVRAWQSNLALSFNPSLGSAGLTKIVKLSRETGVLLPTTSYIVVENTAQWKMLERKETQKLGNQNALEFEAVPESGSTLLCLIIGAGVLILIQRRSFSHRGASTMSSCTKP